MDLIEELSKLVSKLKQERIEFALCGGLAMAVYAFPRATMDIDIMIEQNSLVKVKRFAGELGFSFDSGVIEFQKDAICVAEFNAVISAEGSLLGQALWRCYGKTAPNNKRKETAIA